MPGLTRRARRWVPPKPGVMPRPVSGWPNTAVSAQMRISQAMLSSQPPPRAKPFTAAMVGMGSVSMARKTLLPCLPKASPPSLVRVLISPMSAPATKAFSPLPVMTRARISASAFTAETSSSRSVRTSEFSAFSALGRLMVATAMRPFFSSRMLVISSSSLWFLSVGAAPGNGTGPAGGHTPPHTYHIIVAR